VKVLNLWRRTLKKRGQKDKTTWDRITKLTDDWLPKPRILHPGLANVSPSSTRGGSRMPESGPSGSVRGGSVMSVPTAIVEGVGWTPANEMANFASPSANDWGEP
jgi:RNA-directed DNA polymerase